MRVPKVALLLAILLLWAFGASAQYFNPVAQGPFIGPFGTSGPLPFFNQTPAVNYNYGGQGLAYNVPAPGCSGLGCVAGAAADRADAINFKTSTFGMGFPFQLGFSRSPTSYNYTINISQPGPYLITLWLGDTSTGGSWNIYIDGKLVGNVVTPNTGSLTTMVASQSSSFAATIGTHVLTLAWGSGDASGSAGDLVAWQGSAVTAPTFTGLAMSGLSFTTGSATVVGTASATVSSGTNSPTWSIQTSGTDSATGATCNNYGSDFSIASGTGVVSASAATPAGNYPGTCMQATQSGVANSPYSQAFTLVGSSSSTSTFNTTRNTGTNFSFSADQLTATELTNAAAGNNYSAFTTLLRSDTERFFRFTIGTESSGCGQGLGVASSAEINGAYLGHAGGNSLGIYKDGGTSINNASIGNTGITFAPGDVIDLIIDPIARTVQEVKNGGSPSATLSISTLSTQNVSPAISLCATNDSMVFNGNPPVSYSGATAWDLVPPPPTISGITANPGNFSTPSLNPVEALTANCSAGSCSGATFSLPTAATAGCTTGQIAQNSLFTISGNYLNAVNQITGSPTENVGIIVTLAGATNSGTCYPFTWTGSNATTIACDHGDPYVLQTGPGYTNGIPSGAYAAGFTHCAYHSDFSLPFYTDRTHWLDCAISDATPPLWYNASVNGSAYPPCDRVSIATDGGRQVLQLELTPSDRTYSIGTGITTIEETYTSRGVDFPNAGYFQSTFKLTSASVYNEPYGAHISAWWSWSDTGQTKGGGFEERDFIEIYANGPGYNDVGMPGYNGVGGCGGVCYFILAGFGQPQIQFDPSQYHTIANRITQDGSTGIAQCMYLDNVQQVCGEFTGPFGDNYPDFWNQRNYPVMDVDNPGSPLITVPVDGLVQEIVIFECPGWAGPLNTKGNPCNGPVLTSTP